MLLPFSPWPLVHGGDLLELQAQPSPTEQRQENGTGMFAGLATIAYREATKAFRFRAYNTGRCCLDAELTVSADGFSWSYTAGPAHIENSMHLTGKGERRESTTVTIGSDPPRRVVEMRLNKPDQHGSSRSKDAHNFGRRRMRCRRR